MIGSAARRPYRTKVSPDTLVEWIRAGASGVMGDMKNLTGILAITCLAIALEGCTSRAAPGAPAPVEVAVIEVASEPVVVNNEYVAQAQAPDTIEIRSQVTGLLEQQLFADGARVQKGDVLYVIDRRPFEAQRAQAIAALAQAEANLSNAKQNLARNERLIAEKAVSQQDYDSAVAQASAGAAVVEAQRALLRNAELSLEFATIRASRAGFMSNSQVKAGALVTAQQTLLNTLYSSDPMWVYFTISEERLLQLQRSKRRPDASTPFRIRLADGTDHVALGRLDFVDAAIDAKSATLSVRLSVPNPDRVLRPGLFVRVIVPGLDSPAAIRVPQQAVRELQGTKSVFVVTPEGKAEPRTIVAKHRLENDWVVESGLASGDRVVVEGVGKIRPGAAVKAVTRPKTALAPTKG
jgi:membrane fusion protein (multidrug efflux system)